MSESGERMARAALLLMVTVILSRILGYGREVALYTLFGQNYMTDAYRAAFSIPDFLYMLLVGGALSSAFIPVFSAALATGKEDEGWRSASIVFNYALLFMLVLIFVAYLYTRPLVILLAPGLPPHYVSLAVGLTRIMFCQAFFMALNGFAMGVLNSYQHFAAPALGSLVYNLVIIVFGLAFEKEMGIAAFSWGVVLGAILSFAVQVPALWRVGIKYHLSFNIRDEGFREVVFLMIPVLAGLGVMQFNLFVTQNLSSSLGSGGISALNLAQRIMNLPLGIFAGAIAPAIFPTMTMLAARGEMIGFKRTSTLGLRAIFLMSIPASFGLVAIGEPLVRLLFEQGKFTAGAVAMTSEALFYYCLGIFAYSSIQILNRCFYALKDTVTPVVSAAITIAFNIILSIKLMHPMAHRGLALAYSLAGVLNLIMLLLVLRWKVGKLGISRIIWTFLIACGASGLMFLAVRPTFIHIYQFLNLTPKLNLLISLSVAMALGALVYGVIVYMFKLEESELLLNMLKRRLNKGRV